MLFAAHSALGSALLGTAPLSWQMQLTCWILGFMALPVNVVLKKIRIALTLHEGDMLKIIGDGGQPFSKSELSALFRKPGHKHFRPCGNQLMRAFLRGLTLRFRT